MENSVSAAPAPPLVSLPVVTVAKERKYSSSHRLPWHEGKCHHLHGHTFVLRVYVTGPVQPVVKMDSKSGMVADFAVIGEWLQQLDQVLDHKHLNDTIDRYPTAERMVRRLAYLAKRDLEPRLPPGAAVSKLRFYEEHCFPGAFAEVSFVGRAGTIYCGEPIEPEQPPDSELFAEGKTSHVT